jgi:non-ribosomal peptide synthetase component F
MITHSNVVHFLEWAIRYFDMKASDRISCHSPLPFDLSTFDVYGTFLAGAELHLVPSEISLLPHKLAEFVRQAELTQWFSVPSVLSYMTQFDVLKFHDFPSLERLLWCGEAIQTPTLIYWMQRLPHVAFTNLYGPTEATIASSYYTVPACPSHKQDDIPIGTCCAGEELLILDESLQPVAVGDRRPNLSSLLTLEAVDGCIRLATLPESVRTDWSIFWAVPTRKLRVAAIESS